ncbi:MAG: homoserine dehydrogenase [Clostridia bacterium]|nr:homoserine dehydrogenase [Clostridia bacterium]
MINLAVLGYGIVGSGVVEVIKKNSSSITMRAGEEVAVKKILDIRDFPDSPDRDLLTKNADDVFSDPEISIVVETIGGAGIAYEFTKRALNLGKHVVTSNKELVATHGPELLRLAMEKGVHYLFEASVGGGIPIIRPLHQCLAANEINGVTGILNGTTNYILTQMKREGKDFATALKGAQENGYAEADPTADIEGQDACRKIAILSSIAYNEYVDYRKIPTEGITKISLEDMQYAEAMDASIKLVGMSRKIEDKIYARVSPVMVSREHPLSNVEDVFNAIVVSGNALGDAMFYGRGAGKLPTASAVVADVIDIVKHLDSNSRYLWNVNSEENMVDPGAVEGKYFIRIKTSNSEEAKKAAEKLFGEITWIKARKLKSEDEMAFVTDSFSENQMQEAVEALNGVDAVSEVINRIRVLEA